MFSLASIPLIFAGGIGVAVHEAIELAIPLSMTKFSRSFEAEADYLGVEYLYEAGYDPQAFLSFFERIEAQEKQKPGLIARAFASHPQTGNRIQKTQREIARILPARDIYIVTTSDFEDVKSRLEEIEEWQAATQDVNHPTLRRRTTNEGDSREDQPPTLKRQPDFSLKK